MLTSDDATALSITDILQRKAVITHFQPLISLKKRAVIGVEALTRGVDSDNGEIIPPLRLFAAAGEQGATLALDRLCRQRAFENFASLARLEPELFLFLNFDSAIVDQLIVGTDMLRDQARLAGVDAQQVVIEIIESRVRDQAALQRFVETYRDYGFLIALDDVGSGHSNLNRIPLLKPDILKIDRSLIAGIHQEYYKQVVVKSLINLAREIGAQVVAEGIEDEEEAVTALMLGADILQGFYFATPSAMYGCLSPPVPEKIEHVAIRHRQHVIDHVNRLKAQHASLDDLIMRVRDELSHVTISGFDEILQRLLRANPTLQCSYILDARGKQVTDTLCNPVPLCYRQPNRLYRPANRGTDHAVKDYYYLLMNTGIQKYTTDPYISLASGAKCVTISALFHDAGAMQYLICIDINPR